MARGAVTEGNPELTALFDMVYRKVSEAKTKKQARGRGRARGGAKWGEADEETLLRSILDSASSSVGGGAEAKRDKLAFLEAAIRVLSNRQSRVSDLPRFFLPEDATFADHMKLKAERLGRYKGVRSFDIELLASVTPPTNLKTYQLIDVTRPSENEKKEPVSVAQFLISETDNYFSAVRATPSDPTEPDGFFAFSNVVLPSFFGKVHYMGIDSRYSTIGNVGVHTGILSSLVEQVLLLTPFNCRNISTYMEELLEFGMFFFGEVLRLQPPTDVLSDCFTHFPRPAFLTAEVLFYMRNWSYLSKVIFAFYLAIVEMSLDVSSRKDTYMKARKLMACAVHKFRKKGFALDLIGNHGFFTLRALAGRCLHLLKFDEGYVKKLIMRKNRRHVGEIREIQLFSSAEEESKDQDSDDHVKDEDDYSLDDHVKDEDDDYLDDPKKIDEEYAFWKSLRGDGKDVIIKVLLELDIDISDNHQGAGTLSHQEDALSVRTSANQAPYRNLDKGKELTVKLERDPHMTDPEKHALKMAQVEYEDSKDAHISEDVISTSFGGTYSPVNTAAFENKLLSTHADRLDPESCTGSSGGKTNNDEVQQSTNSLAGGCATLIPKDLVAASEPSYGSTSDLTLLCELSSVTEDINFSQEPGSSTSQVLATVPCLLPSSSVPSSLTPNGKGYKLNPYAKSFTPSAYPRPQLPYTSYYHLNSMPPTLGPGLVVGTGYGDYGAEMMTCPPEIYAGYLEQMMIGNTRGDYYYAPLQHEGRNL